MNRSTPWLVPAASVTAARVSAAAVIAASVLTSGPALAQDWPHWRGPGYDGAAAVTGLPATFGKDENVRWKTALPGPSAATPIVVGDHVFLPAVDTKRERLVAMCISRKTGKVLWTKDAGSGYKADGRGTRVARSERGARTDYASPSAVTDGQRVVFFFGNGDLVAFDYQGGELWRRNVQKEYGDFAFQWTFAAGPTMWEGRLFLPVLQRDEPAHRPRAAEAAARTGIESFLLALDPKTGETLYRHVRPTPARKESRESYGTLIPRQGEGGRKELLLAGGDFLTAHDPATGKELWRWGTWNEDHREVWWRLVPSVVVGDGVAAVCAPKRAPVYGVELGGDGDLGAKALLWKSGGRPNPVSSDVPTPAFHDGHFYVLSDVGGALSKVHSRTGAIAWTRKLPERPLWRASPTVTDGKVYCMNHAGDVKVFDAATGKTLHETAMGSEDDDRIRSSIAAAHGCLFIRTNDCLYCIGE